MSIQFNCPECNRPIEVDEPDGGQKIACYYCQAVVTAPARSQPISQTTVSSTPSADSDVEFQHISELTEPDRRERPEQPEQPEQIITPTPQPVRRRKTLGLIGLLAALAAIALAIVLVGWMMSNVLPGFDQYQWEQMSPQQQRDLIVEKTEELIQDPPLMMSLAALAIVGLPFVAFGFSLAGIVKNSGRGLATAGLILSSLFLLLMFGAITMSS